MSWRTALALGAGCAALLWILHGIGLAVLGRDVALAGWVLPMTALVHLCQLFFSAEAWRRSIGPGGPGTWRVFRLRWIREGVNALLPVAQIGGQVVGARLLARNRVAPALAAAATILDLTLEAMSQLIFTLGGILMLLFMRRDHAWLGWVSGGLVLTTVGVAAFVALQRAGALRLIEGLMERIINHWPSASAWSMEGLHRNLMMRQGDWPALLAGFAWHNLGWALGGAEVWIVLAALGHRVGPAGAVVIESLGMAARSAGFAVPGAVGVQEGGFVLVAALFGVTAEAALALSVMKRLRELLVGVPALVAWHAEEGRARRAPALQLDE